MASIPYIQAQKVRSLIEKERFDQPQQQKTTCAQEAADDGKVQLGKTWADPEVSPTMSRRGLQNVHNEQLRVMTFVQSLYEGIGKQLSRSAGNESVTTKT